MGRSFEQPLWSEGLNPLSNGVRSRSSIWRLAHEQRVNVELFAESVHGNQVEMEIEFRGIEDLHGQAASGQVSGSQSIGYLPDTLLGIVWGFEFVRVVQGRLALLMSSTSFSRSSREGFWPESVRKKTGSWATSFSSLRT